MGDGDGLGVLGAVEKPLSDTEGVDEGGSIGEESNVGESRK